MTGIPQLVDRTFILTKGSAIAERPRCRVRYNHCDIIGLKILNSMKKRKIKAITAFNIIQDHRSRYQSKARMRLPISD